MLTLCIVFIQVFIYDISRINQWSSDVQNNDETAVIPPWKVLDAHVAAGKAYGAYFVPEKKSLVTFGADHFPKVWSLSGG